MMPKAVWTQYKSGDWHLHAGPYQAMIFEGEASVRSTEECPFGWGIGGTRDHHGASATLSEAKSNCIEAIRALANETIDEVQDL